MPYQSISSSRSVSSARSKRQNSTFLDKFSARISELPPDEWKLKTVALKELENDVSNLIQILKAEEEQKSGSNGTDIEELSLTSSLSGSTRYRPSSSSVPNSPTTMRVTRPPNIGSRISNASQSSRIMTPTDLLHPNYLRNLAFPFRDLLADLRALVVKASCYSLAALFKMLGDRACLLFKDICPSVISLHGQTVKVMHGYAENAMMTMVKYTKCRPIIINFVKEARQNKNKDVRCICVLYLKQLLTHWPANFVAKDKNLEILIGKQFLKSLRDPAQQVRIEARKAYIDVYREKFPDEFMKLLNDTEGPLAREPRLKKSLLAQVEKEKKLSSTAAGRKKTHESSIDQHSKAKHSTTSVSDKKNHHEDAQTMKKSKIIEPKQERVPDSRVQSNPFSGAILTPPPSARNKHSEKSLTPIHDSGSEAIHRAARSIQAAARGMNSRNSIISSLGPVVNPTSPEMAMIRDAKKAVSAHNAKSNSYLSGSARDSSRRVSLIGKTAKQMAVRRKTLGVGEVPPLPPTPDSGLKDTRPNPILEATVKRKSGNSLTGISENNEDASEGQQSNSIKEDLKLLEQNFSSDNRESTLFSPLNSFSESPTKDSNNKRRMLKTQLSSRLMRGQSFVDNEQDSVSLDGQEKEIKSIANMLLSEHKKHINEMKSIIDNEVFLIRKYQKMLLKNELTDESLMEYFEESSSCMDRRSDAENSFRIAVEKIIRGS